LLYKNVEALQGRTKWFICLWTRSVQYITN